MQSVERIAGSNWQSPPSADLQVSPTCNAHGAAVTGGAVKAEGGGEGTDVPGGVVVKVYWSLALQGAPPGTVAAEAVRMVSKLPSTHKLTVSTSRTWIDWPGAIRVSPIASSRLTESPLRVR